MKLYTLHDESLRNEADGGGVRPIRPATPQEVLEVAAEILRLDRAECPNCGYEKSCSCCQVTELDKNALGLGYTPSPLVEGPPPEDAEDGWYLYIESSGHLDIAVKDGKWWKCVEAIHYAPDGERDSHTFRSNYGYMKAYCKAYIHLPSAEELREGVEG